MPAVPLPSLRAALEHAGIEIYRATSDVLEVAERVRMHIMDSGIRVRPGAPPVVEFVVRAQRCDFPHAPADQLYEAIRRFIASSAAEQGFQEAGTREVQVRDPVDPQRILDTWYEVTFRSSAKDAEDVVAKVRWALAQERYLPKSANLG